MTLLRTCVMASSLLILSVATASAQGTMVTCKDGVKSKAGQGACSRHGGIAPAGETKAEMKKERVDEKMAKSEMKKDRAVDKMAAKKDEKAEAKKDEKSESKMEKKGEKKMAMADEKESKGAIAECKDHTYSHARTHRGACSRHGGVSQFLDGKK